MKVIKAVVCLCFVAASLLGGPVCGQDCPRNACPDLSDHQLDVSPLQGLVMLC